MFSLKQAPKHSGCETMNFVCMVATVLATMVVTTAPFECNLSEANETHLCRGEEGAPVIFHLSKVATSEIRLVKDDQYLVLTREISGAVKTEEGYNFERIDMGTFNLINSWKNYSGDYKMEEFNSDGKLLKKITMRLEIYDVGTSVPIQTVVIISSFSAVTVVLLVTFTLAVLRRQTKPRHPTANIIHSENEVIYADVRLINNTRGNRQKEP